jgi:hypothetical protein
MTKARTLALLSILTLPFLSGCIIAAAAGAAAYGGNAYANGSMDGVTNASLDKTWRATLAAITDMGLNITSKTRDGTSARIVALTTDRTQVEIELARRSSDFTRVSIRVGIFGDEPESRRILSMIKARL